MSDGTAGTHAVVRGAHFRKNGSETVVFFPHDRDVDDFEPLDYVIVEGFDEEPKMVREVHRGEFHDWPHIVVQGRLNAKTGGRVRIFRGAPGDRS